MGSATPPHLIVSIALADVIGALLHVQRIATSRPKGGGHYTAEQRLADIQIVAAEALERCEERRKEIGNGT